MRLVTATLIWGAMTLAAHAAPGQCSVSGFDTFDCDIALDGGGLTFGLPDGQTFAFSLDDDGVGTGYMIAADAAPGARPDEIENLVAVEGQPGCWAREDDFQFCVLIEE